MNKKAIRILIVGGQGTGKTTLAKKIAEIITSTNVPGFSAKREVRIIDEGVESFIRDEGNVANKMVYNTIEVYQESPNPVASVVSEDRIHTSLYINLTAGYIQDVHGYLPDDLRQPITNAATEQINWVNERFPMCNGRVVFRAECEISEEDKKKLIETSTRKEGGEIERTLTSNDEAVTEALKNLAQDLAKIAKRKQKRRQIYRYIRVTLAFISASFFIISAAQAGADGSNFIYTLSCAFAVGVLSNVFTND